MSSIRKRGNGYEEVRDYILAKIRNRSCQADPLVRISGPEISEVIGISRQAVSEHINRMIRRKLIRREGRCDYAFAEAMETSNTAKSR